MAVGHTENEKGSALMAAIGLSLVLLILAAGAMPVAVGQLRATGAFRSSVQAHYIADAGIGLAVEWFNQGYGLPASPPLDSSAAPVTYNGAPVSLPDNHPDPYVDASGDTRQGVPSSFAAQLTDQPFGGGRFTVTALLLAVDPELWELRSVGTSTLSTREVRARIRRAQIPFFDGALFGEESVVINGNVVTDSYDSAAGPYGPDNRLLSEASVGSNQDISLTGNTTIYGDATPGPDGALTMGPNVVVAGSTDPRPQARELPPVPDPSGAISLPDISLSGNSTYTLTSGTYRVGRISVTGNASLIVDATGGPVILFIEDSMDVAGNGIVTLSQRPRDFRIFSASEASLTIGGNAAFFGQVYAPAAEVHVVGNGDIYGALVGRQVTLDGNAALHYDLSLADETASGSFRIVSWWRVP